MTPDTPPSIDRLYDLLAERATRPLTPAEAAELRTLLAKWPHVDEDGLDLAAAAVAASTPPVDLPDRLRAKLGADIAAMFGEPDEVVPLTAVAPRRGRAAARWAVAGWVTAAGVAGVLLWSRWPAADTTPAQRRDQLLAAGAATFASKPGSAASARVVWDQARQEGYLEVRGLPANDPARSQYQLWVVDAGRGKPGQPDPNNRVDGGVFDVRPDGTALVPVRPAVRVFAAAGFAVTAEPPGGVIVSRAADNVVAVLSPAGRE